MARISLRFKYIVDKCVLNIGSDVPPAHDSRERLYVGVKRKTKEEAFGKKKKNKNKNYNNEMRTESNCRHLNNIIEYYILYNYLVPRRVKKLSRSFRSNVPLNYIYILAERYGFIHTDIYIYMYYNIIVYMGGIFIFTNDRNVLHAVTEKHRVAYITCKSNGNPITYNQ